MLWLRLRAAASAWRRAQLRLAPVGAGAGFSGQQDNVCALSLWRELALAPP